MQQYCTKIFRQLIYVHFCPFLGTGIAWKELLREETKSVIHRPWGQARDYRQKIL